VSSVLTPNSDVYSALRDGVEALRAVSEYRLPAQLARRMHELGERKEFLTPEEHAELMELVEFAENRTIEKLKAMLALKRLRETVPELFENP